jgi:uncharacterized protein (TIGR02453 family)
MFPPEAIAFLRNLARNNRRDWFQPRKEIFEAKVRAPMIAVIEAVNAAMMEFAPEHVTDPKKAFYRIYRDTRFSADKTPYKTHVAAIWPRHGLEKHASAGFYFQVSAKGVGVGAGLYMPGPEELRAVRAWLADNHTAFRKATTKPEKIMGALQGDAVTRMPKGFAADHPAADLIRMKQWLYWRELDVDLATSRHFASELVKRFRAVAPVIEMLNAPLLRARKVSAGSLL